MSSPIPVREADVLRFTVPLVPPSVNHYVKHTRKGRHYVTAEGKAFKDAIVIFSAGNRLRSERYAVKIWIYLGFAERGDIDNFAKCVLDGLVLAGVIHSDAAIDELTLTKGRDATNPRTEIEVKAL